jgi:hypothetical protein
MYLVCLKRKNHPQLSSDVCLSLKCSKLVKITNKIGDWWECDYKPRVQRLRENREAGR